MSNFWPTASPWSNFSAIIVKWTLLVSNKSSATKWKTIQTHSVWPMSLKHLACTNYLLYHRVSNWPWKQWLVRAKLWSPHQWIMLGWIATLTVSQAFLSIISVWSHKCYFGWMGTHFHKHSWTDTMPCGNPSQARSKGALVFGHIMSTDTQLHKQ